ncbi:DUF6339 family protein [Streptomyces luomodiensis]|uniref:DUF6339 family protein n=1 Tax=Streptomyces luomodiensis TaxID=3026192 RepID=A0ABY9UZ93_9ACTN|nr:DUF6339 family protein [Streptomyces sp. SCA4-21]WNE97910.1 DUF6339 family protein [Streptomyces sp. SCA4-21]
MIRTSPALPEVLALLPTPAATQYLTWSVLAGQEDPPRVALQRVSKPIGTTAARWQTVPVRELVEEAMRRFAHTRTQADAWLAPRLHATLRMTRAEAADPELWNFVSLVVAPDYVVWRHRGAVTSATPKPTAPTDRFVGTHHKQAFARLWWAAEMFRDGEDYRSAEFACGNQDVLNTALKLNAIDHRPTALALLRILRNLAERKAPRLGDHVNALASEINLVRSTLMCDFIAPVEPPDADAVLDWIAEGEAAPPVPLESLPEGPRDGRVPETSVDVLVNIFEKIHEESTHLRRRGATIGGSGTRVSLAKPGV